MKQLVVAPDKVAVVLTGHPWIFSGAIIRSDPIQPGELVHLVDDRGQFLALGYAHPEQSLICRILSYQDLSIEELLTKRLLEAYALRQSGALFEKTNAYRLINAEGDRLGGLIVDVYDTAAVIQISTCGMHSLKPLIIKLLLELFDFTTIIERSDSSSRSLEGLEPSCGLLYGNALGTIQVFEGDVILKVDLEKGQKTGFFLDQRPMREALKVFAQDKHVLNMFSYTGGFSLHALKAGALSCTSVDVDKRALALLDELIELNQLEAFRHKSVLQDAFLFLEKEDLSCYDLLILDPPAFAKKRGDIENASKGYKKLMTQVFSKVKEGAIVYLASCSYFMDEKLFEKLLLQAAMETKTILKFVLGQIEALDHPRLLAHKEGSYLKGFTVQVFKK